MDSGEAIRKMVKRAYGRAAHRGRSCCGAEAACGGLYDAEQKRGLPREAVLASLGCGNPTPAADLRPGEVVLDMGSGGGIDVLLAAARVGPQGVVYGLDMTDAMLALARENQCKAGADNVRFLKGEMEKIPLPDASVDVVISNCAINLAVEKDRVLREAFRVLRPGGRLAVADVVAVGEMPPGIRRRPRLWAGCVAGALQQDQYRAKLAAAGFTGIELQPAHAPRPRKARARGPDAATPPSRVSGRIMSAMVRARKPGSPCCAPGCCS